MGRRELPLQTGCTAASTPSLTRIGSVALVRRVYNVASALHKSYCSIMCARHASINGKPSGLVPSLPLQLLRSRYTLRKHMQGCPDRSLLHLHHTLRAPPLVTPIAQLGSMALTMQRRAAAPARAARSTRVTVVARATAQKPSPTKTATGLTILARLEELGLLSKVEDLGLLSKLEASGLTLKKIEESKLLSKAEKSGLLTVIADKGTPGLLTTLGFAAAAGAAALVYFIPDDTTTSVAAQAVGAGALGGAAVAALVGSNILSDLQKV